MGCQLLLKNASDSEKGAHISVFRLVYATSNSGFGKAAVLRLVVALPLVLAIVDRGRLVTEDG